jgi:DNA (cytosine-5)-methyltransferase 1
MRVVSLFSGVGGFDLGLERSGMSTVAQVEWDAKCQQVLARHWPDVPRWGDVSDVNGADLPDCDLVAFGSPCQDLSIGGKRAGMVEGETRSGLFYQAIRIIEELQDVGRGPAWVIWENVVGALSSNRGRDFAAVVDSLAGLGAVDVQWRVLDAQWFGVAQRRRRVYVVARLDPRAAGRPQVLPVGASVRRDSPTGREARQKVAGTLGSCTSNGSPSTTELDGHGCHVIVGNDGTQIPMPLSPTLPEITGTVTTAFGAKNYSNVQEVLSGSVIPVAFAENQRSEVRTSDVVPSLTNGGGKPGQGYPAVLAPTLTAYNLDSRSPQSEEQQRIVGAVHASSLAVRRLTPRECERLMGWPDDWTRYADDGAEIADSHRYRMCGNGVVTNVAEWIGRRIIEADR